MIKLKDILLEGKPPSIFVPRRIDNRLERMISLYVRNGSKGNLNLSNFKLTKLPEILKNVNVGGDFNCNNNLISLKGAPETVGGAFWCSYNKLTSLEGAPTSVNGNFWCGNNKLTSLKGAPTSVGGNFYGDHNELTSLEGAPKTVGINFYCNSNKLISLKGAPSSVGKDFYCQYNLLTSLEGAPSSVGKDFHCFKNPVQFTERDVRAVCDVKGNVYV